MGVEIVESYSTVTVVGVGGFTFHRRVPGVLILTDFPPNWLLNWNHWTPVKEFGRSLCYCSNLLEAGRGTIKFRKSLVTPERSTASYLEPDLTAVLTGL